MARGGKAGALVDGREVEWDRSVVGVGASSSSGQSPSSASLSNWSSGTRMSRS